VRRWLFVFIALGMIAGGWLAFDWLRLAGIRTLMMTSADPGVIGLVASGSMEPVEVSLGTTLQVRTTRDANGRPLSQEQMQREHRITFRLPAGYVTRVGKAREDKYPWIVGFTVWSDSFEPYTPDLIRSQEDRVRRGVPRNAPSRPDDLLAQRMRNTGEQPREFEVTSAYGIDPQERQWILRLTGAKTAENKPCERAYDPALDMTRVTVPAGVAHYGSCLYGQGQNGVNYLKTASDGSTKFIVTCDASGIKRDGQLNQPDRCRLLTYYRNWPLSVWVRHSELLSLDALIARIITFLDAYVLSDV